MENLFNEEFIGFLILVIIIIFVALCVCALYSVAKLHSDLNKIAEEIKFLKRRDDMIELNNMVQNKTEVCTTNGRRCRISYSFLLDGQIAISSFVTTLPPKIENDVNFFDTIRSRVVKDIDDNNLDVGSYENIAVIGWSFYD